jgi:hypothetical protein
MSLLNAYHNKLVKILDEEIASAKTILFGGSLDDIAQYKYHAGRLHGLMKLNEFAEEAMSAVNKGE